LQFVGINNNLFGMLLTVSAQKHKVPILVLTVTSTC